MTILDDLIKAKKRKNELIIKTLPGILQVMRQWVGAYDMNTGHIEIGSTEKETSSTLWHEQLHKYFFEKESLEAGVMWDNIASDIEQWLNLNPATIPHAMTLPPKKAISNPHKHKTLEEKGIIPDIKPFIKIIKKKITWRRY